MILPRQETGKTSHHNNFYVLDLDIRVVIASRITEAPKSFQNSLNQSADNLVSRLHSSTARPHVQLETLDGGNPSS